MHDDIAGSGEATVELTVAGMHCASCVALIEETLAALPGVVRSTVDLESNRGAVTFEPASTTVGAICAAVTSIGYVATPLAAGSAPE